MPYLATSSEDFARRKQQEIDFRWAESMNIILDACFALILANLEKGLLVTSDRKEFEPVIPLNICQIYFIR